MIMNPINRSKAEEKAKLSYTILVIPSETTDGKPSFVALNPELRGCMGQGQTEEEAIIDLDLARIDYIHSLLDDNLPVPPPQPFYPPTITSSFSISYKFTRKADPEILLEAKPFDPEDEVKRGIYSFPISISP